jgi:hypothetical protein
MQPFGLLSDNRYSSDDPRFALNYAGGGVTGQTPTNADAIGRLAYGLTNLGGVQDAAGLLGGPSVAENIKRGNNLDASLQMLAALPMVGMLGTAGKATRNIAKAAKPAEAIAEAVPQGIVAYHGSPHSFDQFSLDKIGTGEGAQVYGHGLYFADNEDVAKSYRDTLSGKLSGVKVDGVPAEQTGLSPSAAQIAHMHLTGVANMEELLARNTASLDKANAILKDNPNSQLALMNAASAKQSIDAINEIKGKNIAFEPSKGSMYQVRINADPEQFFNWDKPLSEQSQSIQDALKQLSNNPKNGFNLIDSIATLDAAKADPRLSHLTKRGSPVNPTGSSIYENLANERGAVDWPITADADMRKEYRNKASVLTSQDMRNAGIPGIKYLDQGSRSEGVGSHNYVVFDDSLIDILKKYGLVGLLGGGAAMGASQQQQQGVPSL